MIDCRRAVIMGPRRVSAKDVPNQYGWFLQLLLDWATLTIQRVAVLMRD